MSLSVGGSKGGNKSSSSAGVDAQTQAQINRVYGESNRMAGIPGAYNQGATGAQQFYGGVMGPANVGLSAMSGDANAVQSLMNPFQGQVIDAVNADWGQRSALTQRNMDDAAQAGGAFGGSRHGVAAGVAAGEDARNQMAQIAALRAGGYSEAMQRAGSLANFGFGAAQGGIAADRGMLDTSSLGIMKFGMQGTPYGTWSKSKGTQYGVNAGISPKVMPG